MEFTFAVEKAFGLYLPEADAVKLETPGLLVDYLEGRLSLAQTSQCLDQLAFYKVRRGAMAAFDLPRAAIRPDTPWASLLPPKHLRHSWQVLGSAVGAPAWPKFSTWRPFTGDAETVGRTARFLATHCPNAVKEFSKTWTRKEIIEVVARLMADQLGITCFNMTDRFVHELRIE